MDFKKIQLPIQIQQQPQYTRQISHVCHQLYKQTQHLRSIIQTTHQIYGILSKSVSKQAESYQKKLIQKDDAFANRLVTFIRSVNNIFTNIQHQLNNNIGMLRTKDNKVIKKRMQILTQKLNSANQQFQKYLTVVSEYNKQGTQYVKKAQYFSDFENNPIKYYSKSQALKKYQKCNKRQFQLRRKLETYFKIKKDVQLTIRQLRVAIKEYYNMFTQSLQDYKKISLMLREKLSMLRGHNEAVIEEATQEDQISGKENSMLNSKQRYKKMADFSDLNARKRSKQIIYQRQIQSCIIFQSFLSDLGNNIKKAQEMISALWESKQFNQFEETRSSLSAFIQPDMQQNRDSCIKQIANFKTTFSRLVGHLNKVKLFEQITKIRQQNYKKFNNQIQGILESERLKIKRSQLITEYFAAEQKHEKSGKQYMARYKQYVMELESLIHKEFQFKKADPINIKNKSVGGQNMDKSAGIFQYKYFSILNLSYFISKKQQQPQFCQSKHVQNYLRVMNANKLQQIHLDWQIQQNSSKINRNKGQSSILCCCGLVPRIKQSKKKVDSFTCAVKDGYFLLQGNLTVYQHAIRFFSMFGKTSVLRSTQIVIPRSQILGIVKDRYISLMITFRTMHGDIQFTSFITDPYEFLISRFPNQHLESPRSNSQRDHKISLQIQSSPSQDYQMRVVSNKFKQHFRRFLEQQQIYLDHIDIVPRQKSAELSIQVSYHQIKQGNIKNSMTLKPGKLQIKLTKVNGVFESVYKVDQMCSSETRKKLIKATKRIINIDENESISNTKKREIHDKFRIQGNNDSPKAFHTLGQQFSNVNNSILNRQFNNISRIVGKERYHENQNSNTTFQDLKGFQFAQKNIQHESFDQPFFKSTKKLQKQRSKLKQGYSPKQQSSDKANRDHSFKNSTSDISGQQVYIKNKDSNYHDQYRRNHQSKNKKVEIRNYTQVSHQCFKSISQNDQNKSNKANGLSTNHKENYRAGLSNTKKPDIKLFQSSHYKRPKQSQSQSDRQLFGSGIGSNFKTRQIKHKRQLNQTVNAQISGNNQHQKINFFQKQGINPLWLVLGLFGILSVLSRIL